MNAVIELDKRDNLRGVAGENDEVNDLLREAIARGGRTPAVLFIGLEQRAHRDVRHNPMAWKRCLELPLTLM